MTRHYRRRRPGRRENLKALAVAAGVAVGVGASVFYVTRLLLSREKLGDHGSEERGSGKGTRRLSGR